MHTKKTWGTGGMNQQYMMMIDDHVLGGSLRLRIVSHKRVKRSAVPSMQMSQQVLMMVYHGNGDDNAQWQHQ